MKNTIIWNGLDSIESIFDNYLIYILEGVVEKIGVTGISSPAIILLYKIHLYKRHTSKYTPVIKLYKACYLNNSPKYFLKKLAEYGYLSGEFNDNINGKIYISEKGKILCEKLDEFFSILNSKVFSVLEKEENLTINDEKFSKINSDFRQSVKDLQQKWLSH